MTNKKTTRHIDRLRRSVEQKVGWGSVTTWHSKMFEDLSDQVFSSTGIMLSTTTLKRFFGVVNHQGSPSITTLDALSQFIGMDSWHEFKLKKPKHISILSTRKSVYVTMGFILALVIVSLIGNRRPEILINSSEFSFSSNVLSNEYPNSVVFDFHIPLSLEADSLDIQQYWDPTKTIRITKNQRQATGIYYYPGYFRAKLLVDGQEALSHDLFLKSEGWLGMIEYKPVPQYFDPITKGLALSVPKDILDEVITSEEPQITSLQFVDDLGNISGDNFSFSTTIKNSFDDRWAVCQTVNLYFLGTTGAMIIPFSKIGCSSDNNLMLNDVYLRGKEHDLSALSADFSNPAQLKCQVIEKRLSVFIDDEKVYTLDYHESMGKLVGIRFKFLGIGEVLDYELIDQNDRKIMLESTHPI